MSDLLPYIRDGIALRRLRTSDLRNFQNYRCDPTVGQYQGWSVSTDIEAEGFLEVMSKTPLFASDDWTQLAIADAATDVLIGDVGVHIEKDASAAEIGFTLAPAAQGKGIASRAVRMTLDLLFQHTSVMRVLATTDARNERSIGLLERVGMRRIASREAMFRGEPCIEHIYVAERPANATAVLGRAEHNARD